MFMYAVTTTTVLKFIGTFIKVVNVSKLSCREMDLNRQTIPITCISTLQLENAYQAVIKHKVPSSNFARSANL